MSLSRKRLICLLLCVAPASAAMADKGDYVLGGGLSIDDADGKSLTVLGDYSLTDATSVSASLGRSFVDLPRFQEIETWYGDLSVDTFWDPAGLRVGASYWGDSDILDSVDLSASIYTRGKTAMLGIDVEHRDFELELPPIDIFARTSIPFSANGLGLSGRVNLSSRASLYFSGMSYEYDVNLRVEDAARFNNLLSISRLSLLSSLVDWNASVGFGMDFGLQRWSLDVARWRGAIDGGDSHSVTISWLAPAGASSDIEFSLGYDDSEFYGRVGVLSVLFFFYGID